MRQVANWGLVWFLAAAGMAAAGCGKSGDLPTASINGASESKEKEVGAAHKPAFDRLHPVVQIHTNLGDILVKLDAEHAALTVDNFLAYVEAGHYDNTLFHQVSTKPIGIILGGGYDKFNHEKPAHSPIRNEARNGLKNTRGAIAMARRPDAIDSSTAQFFIDLADNPDLDYKKPTAKEYGYCVFGQVVEGMDVVDKIGQVPCHDTDKMAGTPVEQVVIQWMHVMK